MAKKRMIQAINEALDSEMAKDSKVILFGEDVEISLFGDTRGLKDKHGADRVRNMPISETVMSGMYRCTAPGIFPALASAPICSSTSLIRSISL